MSKLSIATLAGVICCMAGPAVAQGTTGGLPEGQAKQLVEGVCTGCHQTNQITRSSGYTLAGWRELAATMIDLSKTPQEQAGITQYLATHFPPNTKRAPKLVPGSAKISFKEWVVPTLGQREFQSRAT